jgi:hypothetical protein
MRFNPNDPFLLVATYVAGLQYHVPAGQADWPYSTALTPVREPNNPHDANAVRLDIDGRKIGYVPRTIAPVVAALLDNDYPVIVAVDSCDVRRNQVLINVMLPSIEEGDKT